MFHKVIRSIVHTSTKTVFTVYCYIFIYCKIWDTFIEKYRIIDNMEIDAKLL